MMKIIKEEYANTLLEIVRKLFEDWEEKKDVREIGD